MRKFIRGKNPIHEENDFFRFSQQHKEDLEMLIRNEQNSEIHIVEETHAALGGHCSCEARSS